MWGAESYLNIKEPPVLCEELPRSVQCLQGGVGDVDTASWTEKLKNGSHISRNIEG